MSRSRRSAAALALVAAAAGAVHAGPAPVGATASAPPSQRVYVVTDSVGLGAKSALESAFPPGWRVTVDGDAGEFVETLERRLVRGRHAADPDAFGDHAVVAAGYNYPYWDPERFDRSVDSMIATLRSYGVRHIHWVTLREIDQQYVSPAAWRQIQPYFWYFPRVNEHLERALERHPDLSLIDWAAAANRTGLTYDAIHLDPTGAALYAGLVRGSVDAVVTRVEAGSTTRLAVPDPDGVAAVAVNLTTTQPRTRGYLAAYSCDDDEPEVSTHNFVRAQTVAHATIVPLGPSGEICVLASDATNLVVDLSGRFLGEPSDDGPPERLLDTRHLGARPPTATTHRLAAGSGAVVVTLTAIGATEPGFARIVPCGATAGTSNVNMAGPDPVPNVAVVRAGADGALCASASTAAHLVADRLGTLPGDGVEVGVAARITDTRETTRLRGGDVLRLTAAQLGASGGTGLLLNLTGVNSDGRGHVVAYGCDDGVPPTSSLNLERGAAVANVTAIAADGDGDVCIRTSVATDLVVDLQGRITSGFVGDDTRLLDTRVAPAS